MEKKYQIMGWYLAAIGFLGIFSTTISKNPVLPLLVNQLGGKSDLLGLISAMSPLAGILISFPIGFLADVFKKKRLLIISALIFATAPLLYLLVNEPLLLIPIRFFHGMATAIMGPVATTMIVEMFEKRKAEKLGIYSSATLFGRTLAPLVGGLLISYLGAANGLINFRMVYFVAFLAALPIVGLAFLIPESDGMKVKEANLSELLMTLKHFFREKILISTAMVEMATYFAYGVLEAYLPIYLISRNVKASQIGLLFSLQIIAIALTKPFFGKIADKTDKRNQILVGVLMMAGAMGLINFVDGFLVMSGVILLFALGMSLSTIATGTYIAEQVERNKQGSALGLLSSLMDVGQTSGPFLTGFVITYSSYQIGFSLAGVVALVAAMTFLFFAYRRS